MPPLPNKILRHARARWNGALGLVYFRLGRLGAAQRRFHRVLELRGDDFHAYLTLSRIACARGDYRGWRRESEHARRMAPERFARLSHRWSLPAPHTAGALLYEAGERATWRPSPAPRPSSRPLHPSADSPFHKAPPELDESWLQEQEAEGQQRAEALEWFDRAAEAEAWIDAAGYESAIDGIGADGALRDDFSSDRERARFADAVPISRAEIAAHDLDDLARRLGDC